MKMSAVLAAAAAAALAFSTAASAAQNSNLTNEQKLDILQALYDDAYGEGSVNVRTGEIDREKARQYDKEHNFQGPQQTR